MADSPSVTCESGAGQAVSDLSGEGNLEAGQLGALRSVLLGPLYHDLEVLRARIAELEDPNRQVARISAHLPRALSLRPSTDPEIAAAFSPLIEAVVWEGRGRNLGREGGGVAHRVKRWLW